MSKQTRRNKFSRKNELQFVNLETRNLLAGISFDSTTGIVTVDGSNGPDAVRVTQTATNTTVVFANLDNQSFSNSQVTSIVFLGRSGDDWFRNDTSIDSLVYGHDGNDTLVGGSGNDRMRGGNGNDRMYGNGGNDFIVTDNGDDFASGGSGNDRMFGGSGRDRLYGDDNNDYISSGEDDDFSDGGSGDDQLFGNLGNDSLYGGSGNDEISGQDGDDYISGDDGDDKLYGNNGDDRMIGGNSSDRMAGGSGNDRMFGGFGIDVLFGQDGEDSLNGGDDNDRLFGDSGNDDLNAGSGDDYLRGGAGMDRLYGHNGRDDLGGDDDNDDLYGGPGDDILRGGRGNDDYFRDSSDLVFDDSDDYNADGDFEIRGTISNLNTLANTFTLLGLSVNYSSAALRTSLSNSAFVKVEGQFDSGNVTAHEIEFESDQSHHNFEARGIVSNLNSSAKTFTFLGFFTVNYGSSSVSSSLANGAVLEVEGTLSENSVSAHRVGNDSGGGGSQRDTNGAFELRAAVTDLNISTKTFKLLGVSINYSPAQVYGSFTNGSFVKVDGSYSSGTITARQVEIEVEDDRDENVRARGEIQNLNTSNSTFEFLGITVDYSNSRLETTIANGKSIELRGWFENGSIDAERIDT